MESFFDVWQNVCDLIKDNISSVAFESWIKNLVPVRFDNGTAEICAQNPYHRDIVDQYYSKYIKQGFEDMFGFPIEISILVEPTEVKNNRTVAITPVTDGYTFDNFVVGPSNRFAHSAALAVANNPCKSYNPLFLYGPSGLGKTHLLNAIKNAIKEDYPTLNVIYKQGEEFTHEIIDAIHQVKTPEFREIYRKTDVLIIDDIQFIIGKQAVQIEFFNTLNTLIESSRQVIISADRAPKQFDELDERMKSRFETGLLADIQTPDFETRITIINKKAATIGITIPDQTVQYIANELQNNIRQLEGIINKISAHEKLSGEIPPLSQVTTLISEIKREDLPEPISLDKIINTVAQHYNVTSADICSKKQNANVAAARHYFIYIAHNVSGLSLKTVGKFVGRDHSTASISNKKVENEMKQNPYTRAQIEEIIKNIKGY